MDFSQNYYKAEVRKNIYYEEKGVKQNVRENRCKP